MKTKFLLLGIVSCLTLYQFTVFAEPSKCYVSVLDDGGVASKPFSNLSISLISRYVEPVAEIPREGISTDACFYLVTLSTDESMRFAMLTGPQANGVGQSTNTGIDAVQQALLKALFQATPSKRDELCQDFGDKISKECQSLNMPDIPAITIAQPTFRDGELPKGICAAPMDHRDYRHCDLERQTFRNLDLSGSDFSGVDLDRSHFMNCILNGTRFKGASMERARFTNTTIKSSIFSSADLDRAQFINSILIGVDFSLSEMERVKFPKTTIRKVSMQGAHLENANFIKATLQYVDLSNAELEDANFNGATLDYVDLTNADLEDVDLSRATLSNVVR